jgi:hypothetical protein
MTPNDLGITLSEQQREQMLDEIIEFAEPKPLQPEEFTTREYADHAGISAKLARAHLEKQVETGRLTRRKIKGGHWAWRRAGDERAR